MSSCGNQKIWQLSDQSTPVHVMCSHRFRQEINNPTNVSLLCIKVVIVLCWMDL